MACENTTPASPVPATESPADSDQKLVALWLAERPPTTTRYYRRAWLYLNIASGGVEIRAIRPGCCV